MGPTGQLTIQGHPVIGEGGPITVPEGSEITIAADGTISALNPGDPPNTVAPVGRLKLVKAEGNEVQRSDDGLFRLTAEAQAERGRYWPPTRQFALYRACWRAVTSSRLKR